MKYLSLFSGIGGFELGIQQAHEISNMGRSTSPSNSKNRRHKPMSHNSDGNGRRTDSNILECVGFSEIDKYATQIYQKHFPNHKNYGDITKIDAETLPDFEFLCGGFPCQSFSIAGKRGGFADTRGTMFFEIARILKIKQPRLFLLENVKGLLSHEEGRTFHTIIYTLDELGYDVQWQVLNSKNFGVPQNRERIYIVGHLRGTRRPEVFPITNDGGQTDELPRHNANALRGSEGSGSHTNFIANTLTRRYEGAQAVGTYIGEGELNAQETESSGQSILKKGDESDNINGKRRSTHSTNIRRLTPTECERLQGFPDGWTEWGVEMKYLENGWEEVEHEISDTQRYKCCGNAVTVNVIQALMERLTPYA